MPDIKIQSLEGKTFSAYCAMPASKKGPGMLVIQEIFGVNASLRQICDHYASLGYIAVCPDLFWRQQPDIQLSDKTPAEWDRAMELYKGFDVEAGVRDLISTLAHIRAMKSDGGKVGTVGYCLGGKLAWLMATRSDVDAAVSYYGVGLEQMLDEIPDIRNPIMLHIAGLDSYCTPPVREKILKAIERNPMIKAYVYDGADHAFARPNGKNFKADAAQLANQRSEKFFAEYLQS